ncbi:MAG: zinc ABC transporter substrate-binding protein [Salinivirgaceae bacterium]
MSLRLFATFALQNSIIKKYLFLSLSVFSLFIFIGCSQKRAISDKPTVTVSVIPQKFFVDQIAGDWLYVNVMVPPGGNPHTYEPTPMQMKSLSNSLAYFSIGYITFETAWMDKLVSVSPKMKVIDTSVGCELLAEDAWCEEHTELDGSTTRHESYNPHIWLSPKLVKIQAQIIYEALSELYPEHKQSMEQNINRFLAQCDSVHSSLDTIMNSSSGTSFIVYHPVWTYLAKDYNLKQIAIEYNGKEATADKLKNIIDFANKNDIRFIFVQKEFSDAQARTIAEQINGRVVSMNPLNYDWFTTMKEFGEAFQAIKN